MDLFPEYFNHEEEPHSVMNPSHHDYAYEDRMNHPETIAPWDFEQ